VCRERSGTLIHPQALIDKNAKIADNVHIGPFSVIGPDVEIEEGTRIGPHVVINGPTKIGRDNKIYQFASLGEEPQDKKYAGEPTRLEIGDRNVIREFCTISRGTIQDIGYTKIGDDNWIMAYVHIAHDCVIGNHTIFVNSASLAGHVIVEDFVILGGFTLIHQFCKIGAHSFTSMNSCISKDVPPYIRVSGHMAKPYGLNSEGLKRHQFSKETINNLRKAYKILYRSGLTVEKSIKEMSSLAANCEEVNQFMQFLTESSRGIIR